MKGLIDPYVSNSEDGDYSVDDDFIPQNNGKNNKEPVVLRITCCGTGSNRDKEVLLPGALHADPGIEGIDKKNIKWTPI